MELGPILRFELRRTARQGRLYVLRGAIGLVLLGVAAKVDDWRQTLTASGDLLGGLVVPQAMRSLVEQIFLELMLVQAAAIVFLVPGLVAGSIAEEDRRGTMLDLLASPLSSGSIVLGKLVVQLARTGMALGVGFPFALTFGLLGILDFHFVSSAYVMLMAWILFVASLSLVVSVVNPRPRLTTLIAYLLVVGWLFLPGGYALIVAQLPRRFAWLETVSEWVFQGHPAGLELLLRIVTMGPFVGPIGSAWLRSELARCLPHFVGVHLTFAVIFILLAVLLLRPLRLGFWLRRSWVGEPTSKRSRPPIGDDPMFWKERYATSGPFGRPLVRGAFLLVCLILLAPLLGMAQAAFGEWQESWWDGLAWQWKRNELNEVLRHVHATLYFLGLVGVAAIAATSVTGERERGTWISLATTLVTGREVARAKVIGALVALRGLAIPLLLIWTVGLMTGSVHPVGVVAAAIGVVIYLWYAAAIGVFLSLVSKSSEQAIGATLLVLFASNLLPFLFVPLSLVGSLTGSWSGVYLAGATPFIGWASLVSPIDIQEWQAGRVWDQPFYLPAGLWRCRVVLNPGLVRTYAVSLAIHTLGAITATWAAARVFNARGGRRSQS
ncbi:ABC-2 family transporter protein [Singulisphaera sp. GP187]|uniref:ABC transporter permease subunit n=1 Tax=Singulisphaera sp. GP187 TaxID=1882752 RepID=UPI00092C9CAD|nr:ABC transporter permease subunit [Singulisphaera sp. GP187]SIO66110.1 ABC-2 family transporter protein [Singulisphaera sp. GP187]